jgi:hypothetical protein
MHIVALAWMFVVVLMALAEATSTQGTVLGAFFTLLLYGLLPLGLVLYLLGTPMRRRAQRAAEAAAPANLPAEGDSNLTDTSPADTSAAQSHGGGESPGAAIPPERKKP